MRHLFIGLALACTVSSIAHAEHWSCNWTGSRPGATSGYAQLDVNRNASTPEEITLRSDNNGGLSVNLKTREVTRFEYDNDGNRVVIGEGYCLTRQ